MTTFRVVLIVDDDGAGWTERQVKSQVEDAVLALTDLEGNYCDPCATIESVKRTSP